MSNVSPTFHPFRARRDAAGQPYHLGKLGAWSNADRQAAMVEALGTVKGLPEALRAMLAAVGPVNTGEGCPALLDLLMDGAPQAGAWAQALATWDRQAPAREALAASLAEVEALKAALAAAQAPAKPAGKPGK